MADVQVRETDSFIGFQTVDLSCTGLCLQARTGEMLDRVRPEKGGVAIRLRLPAPHGLIEFEAELTWEREVEGKTLTGWWLTKIDRSARDAIDGYIKAHPEAIVEEPEE